MDKKNFRDTIKLNENQRNSLLHRLDESASEGDTGKRRISPRIEYRVPNVTLIITHPAGGEARCIACTRNISTGGLSFLHGGFLHNGSNIRALLPCLDGTQLTVIGEVASCRLVDGAIHEIGVRFDEKIDPLRLADPGNKPLAGDDPTSIEVPKLSGEILCVSENEMESTLLIHHIRATSIEPIVATSTGAAIDQLKKQPFDLILVDLDGKITTKAIREAGFRGDIIALTSEKASYSHDSNMDDNLHTHTKPYDPIRLLSVIGRILLANSAGASNQPIYSQFADDPTMKDMITQYIESAKTTARQLHEAIEADDFDKARTLCQSLRGTAAGYGYPQLTESAGKAITSLDASMSIEESMHELRRVESFARRLALTEDSSSKAA